MTDVNIRMDVQRFSDNVTVDEWLALFENDPRVMVAVLSKFVVDANGNYLDEKAGRVAIGKLTLTQLKETANAFVTNASEMAVPKVSAAT